MTPMHVEILYFEGCPNHELAEQRVRNALAGKQVVLTKTMLHSADEMEGVSFAGSPTILVNGVDPFVQRVAENIWACRVYRTDAGIEGAPSEGDLAVAFAARFNTGAP